MAFKTPFNVLKDVNEVIEEWGISDASTVFQELTLDKKTWKSADYFFVSGGSNEEGYVDSEKFKLALKELQKAKEQGII
jgi:uncharacterized radical SAM superfamily protein